MVCDISSSNIDSSSGIIYRETLTDGAGVSATITNIQNHSSCKSSRVERKHWAGVEEEFWHLVVLKEQLSESDTVSNRIVWWLCQKYRMLSRVDLELWEDVKEEVIHVIPISDYTPLDWIV